MVLITQDATDSQMVVAVIEKLLKRPQYLKIETTNICNANCSFCAYKYMTRPKQVMPMDMFQKTIDDYVAIGGGALTLSPEVGDCLVDSHFLERLRYCRKYDQVTNIGLHTNLIGLNRWTDEQVKEILELIDNLNVSLGPNQTVYNDMFGVDKFETVLAGLERLNALKSKTGYAPNFNINGRACAGEFEVDNRLAQLGVALMSKPIGWSTTYADWGGQLGDLPRNTKVIRAGETGSKKLPCMKPLISSVVFSDGRVGFCGCADFDAKLAIGDLKSQNLGTILSSQKRREYIKSFFQNNLNEYCHNCTFYEPLNMKFISQWIDFTNPYQSQPVRKSTERLRHVRISDSINSVAMANSISNTPEANAPNFSFVMIVLNGMPFIELSLKSIYDFAHEIIIVEGAVEKCAFAANPDGSSTDGTVEFIKSFPDPQHKITLVQGKWPEKCEMQNEALKHVTGNYVWLIDSDEVYKEQDLEKIREILEADGSITQVNFIPDNFWKGFDYIFISPKFFEPECHYRRLFKYVPGAVFTTHRPPTMVWPGSNKTTEQMHILDGLTTRKMGITIYHYSYVLDSQVTQKIELYRRYGWGKGWKLDLAQWYEQCYMKWTPRNRDEIDAKYPIWTGDPKSCTLKFTGTHPKPVLEYISRQAQKSTGYKVEPQVKAKQGPMIAGEVESTGMTIHTESEFASAISELFTKIRPQKIIESGTYLGQGTTTVIAKTLKKLKIDADFYTIEVNPAFYARASEHFRKNDYNVIPVNGLSLPKAMLPGADAIHNATVSGVSNTNIYVDHSASDRVNKYIAETDFNVQDDLLYKCLRAFDFKPDFVLLDSGGHVGNVEFNYLISLLEGPCYIALDDTKHVKHYKSLRQIKSDNRFEIIIESNEKYGFCITKFTPAQVPSRSAEGGDVKNVLITRPDAIGDFIVFSNCLSYFRQIHPHAKISILMQEGSAQLAAHCPYIDEIFTFRKAETANNQYLAELMDRLKNKHFDVAYYPVYSRSPLGDYLTLNSGAVKTVAFRGDNSNMNAELKNQNDLFYSQLVPSTPARIIEHDRDLGFVKWLGANAAKTRPVIWLSEKEEAAVDKFVKENALDNYIVIAPFANVGVREWPLKNWATLLQTLKNETILVVGGPDTISKVNELMALASHPRLLNLCGKTNLLETAAFIKRGKLFIGAESGPAHMATAFDVPNVVIIGGGHFGRFMPYSASTTLVYCPKHCFYCNWRCHFKAKVVPCISQISVPTVVNAAKETLLRSKSALTEPLVIKEIIEPQSVPYSIEETAAVKELYQKGLGHLQANEKETAKAILQEVVAKINPLMTTAVQWNTAIECEDYKDTVQRYIDACAKLAQLCMFSGEFGRIKAIYQHLLENPVACIGHEQRNSFQSVLGKLWNIEADKSIFGEMAQKPLATIDVPIVKNNRQSPEYLVTAIVSTYNSENYIRGCLEDLENQTIADKLEIIVINSGSQQGEEAIVKEFQQKYGNIKYLRTQRESIYAAWNRGIKMASGKYITNANTDDKHLKNALEKLAQALEVNPDKAVVYSDQCRIKNVGGNQVRDAQYKMGEYDYDSLMKGCCLGSQPMWRKSLHDAIGCFDEQFFVSGDYEFWIRASRRYKFLYVNEYLGERLIDDSTVSQSQRDLLSIENSLIHQCYNFAAAQGFYIEHGGISSHRIFKEWPEIAVWKRKVKSKFAGSKLGPEIDIVNQTDNRTSDTCAVSVVVDAFNQSSIELLTALQLQDRQDFEILLFVKSGDDVQLGALKSRTCVIELTSKIGAGAVMNIAAKNSRGAYLANIQPDTIPDTTWISTILSTFATRPVAAIRGKVIADSSTSHWQSGLFDLGDQEISTACELFSNCAYKKSVLSQIGNFDDELACLEGLEISYRLLQYPSFGLDKIMYIPQMQVRLRGSCNLVQISEQLYRQAAMEEQIRRKWPEVDGFFGYARAAYTGTISDCSILLNAAIFLEPRDVERALKYALMAYECDPEQTKTVYMLGSLYTRMARYDLAGKMLESIIEPVLLLVTAGTESRTQADVKNYQTALPCFISICTKLAQCYMNLGELGKVKTIYSILLGNKSIQLVPAQRAAFEAISAKLASVKAKTIELRPRPNPQQLIPGSIRTPVPENSIAVPVFEPLVTAIVSTYNSEKFIRGCLEDLEAQTIADRTEIIVVNTGSQQNEDAIVKEFQARYKNIICIKTDQRETIYAAWNRAVKVARGKFLTNANTDDRHRADAFEKMAAELAADSQLGLVWADQICTDTANGTLGNCNKTGEYKWEPYSRKRLLLGCCVGSQPMWRKSMHDEFGYFDETLTCAGDWDFWCRLSQKYACKHIPEFLGVYYHNESGVEHGRKIHSLYERYTVGKRFGTRYIAVIPFVEGPQYPLVSIIMPACNAQKYIADAIESVLIQSYRNFELIVADDGSTDQTAQIVAGFKDEHIKYLRKENGGVSSARNFAISNSKGSFVIFMDSDDVIATDYILEHLKVFQAHPDLSLAYCDHMLIDSAGKEIRKLEQFEYSSTNEIIRDMFRCGYPVIQPRGVMTRSALEKIGLFDESLSVGEDYDLMRRFLMSGLKLVRLPQALYSRRMAPGSLCQTNSDDKANSHFKVIKRFVECFTCQQLFPDVNWDKMPPKQRTLYAQCLIGATYRAIGKNYAKSNVPLNAAIAFEQACATLKECLNTEPANVPARQLLDQCQTDCRELGLKI